MTTITRPPTFVATISPQGSRQRSRATAFSLFELMTVMAIIAIMAVIVAPAVSNLGTATGLVTGGNSVTNLIGYARQVAVSQNTMTALVVLAKNDSPDDYRAITVLEYSTLGGWKPITGWQALPTGVVFDPNTANSTFLKNSPDPFPFLATARQKNPPIAYKSIDEKTMGPIKSPQGYAARIFLPSGNLQNAEDPAQLRLVEGFIQNGQVVRTRRNGAESANYYEIAIIGATGVTKVTRP